MESPDKSKVGEADEPVVGTSKRIGWAMDQNWTIPEDFDRWAEDEILEMFGIKESSSS